MQLPSLSLAISKFCLYGDQNCLPYQKLLSNLLFKLNSCLDLKQHTYKLPLLKIIRDLYKVNTFFYDGVIVIPVQHIAGDS